MKNYSNLDRGNWAALKLSSVVDVLPHPVVSDIGAGFGWFKPNVEKFNLEWQPFDFVKKLKSPLFGILIIRCQSTLKLPVLSFLWKYWSIFRIRN